MTWTTRPRSEASGITFIEAGSGPRLTLIHGVGLRAEAWGAQIDALSGAFHIRATDLPGHGPSRVPTPGTSLYAYTDALAQTLTAPSLVVGHSMGAMIALDLATRYRERVTGIAALNTIYRRSPEAAQAVRTRAEALTATGDADPEPTLNRWFGHDPSPERTACHHWLITVDRTAYAAAYKVFATHDAPPDAALISLTCPALFMTGADEPNSTPAMSEAMANLAPKGRAVVTQGAAHMLPMTHPDAVTAEIRTLAQEAAR